MNSPRILIAGIGNLFMGDDGFGCEVARRMAQRSLPEGVKVVDFGIRSLDLTYALLDGYEAVILVDAVPRGDVPGTLYVIEPQVDFRENVMLDAHGMDPVKVLEAVAALGGHVDRVLVVGCEPADRDPEAEWEMGLSEAVMQAVDRAIELICDLIKEIIGKFCPAGQNVTGD
ncbi:MAG TPA: hydrogenase maturation protease [Tepidisphaeraceae bacterium]|jgi:hydrogenase maturation protease|nr:hydrogenase maturation protease [Tepidisphaeraceae bacterium]